MVSSEPEIRRTGVLGKPVAHSLSPVLHNAGYRALGLSGWDYQRIECDAEGLPGFLDGLGPEWAGFSVTMPGKRAALAHAVEATDRARAVGAANTLVPLAGGGWRADCTDVAGVVDALRTAGGYRPAEGATGVVLGAGGTAAAAIAGLAELGVRNVTLVARDPARATDALATADRVGVRTEVHRWAGTEFRALVEECAVLVSTVPTEATREHAEEIARVRCVLDVIYHPWPTPVATAVQARGGRLATGLDMLLHQSFGQFEQHTGRPAPRAAMRDALRAATGNTLPLPLAP